MPTPKKRVGRQGGADGNRTARLSRPRSGDHWSMDTRLPHGRGDSLLPPSDAGVNGHGQSKKIREERKGKTARAKSTFILQKVQ